MQDDELSRDTELYDCIALDDVDGCEALIKRGVNLNQTIACSPGVAGQSHSYNLCLAGMAEWWFLVAQERVLPLHAACFHQCPRIVELLLKNGADPNKRDCMGRVPLYLTVRNWTTDYTLFNDRPRLRYLCHNAHQVMELLCSYGAQVAAVVTEDRLLHLTAHYGLRRAAALLCRFGAPLQVRDVVGRTPLHVSAQVGTLDVMDALLPSSQHDVLCAKDTQGRTALHYLCRHRDQQALKHLSAFLRHSDTIGKDNMGSTRPILGGRIIDIADAEGNTPLHIAAVDGNEGAIQVLVLAGANTGCHNHKGQTALFRLLDNPGNVKCEYGIELLYQETLHQAILDKSGSVPCLLSEPEGPWAHLLPQLMRVSQQPPSLKRTCRHVIRRCIGLSNVHTSTVSRLPCAPGLRNTILFNVKEW